MELVSQTFKKLRKAKSIDAVSRILDELQIEKKYELDENAYPQINFTIHKGEIRSLRKQGLLDKDNLLGDVSNQSTIVKLLYAVAWKNGDLKKIRHIIEGIESEQEDEKENALIFYQFGKFLSAKGSEPIIDQHVLRSFGIYQALAENDPAEIERLKKLSVVTKNEKTLIKAYKNWLSEKLHKDLMDCKDYVYHIDKVLFAVGKKIKSEFKQGQSARAKRGQR